MQAQDLKQAVRKQLRERRNAVSAEQTAEWNASIVGRIAASKEFMEADLLLLYAPIGKEIDLLPLMQLARQKGIDVAFPVSDPATCTLSFRIVDAESQFVSGEYGIPEPPQDARIAIPTKKTLCILPGLSFTPSGDRIGYGKGYYDRFLDSFEGICIGAVYHALLSKSLPTEPHDRPVSAVFTERGRIRCADHQAKKEDTALLQKKNAPKAERAPLLRIHRDRTAKSKIDENALPAPRAQHFPPALVLCCFLLLIVSRVVDTAFLSRDTESVGVILLQILVFIVPAVGYSALRGEAFGKRIRITPPRFEHLWFCVCALIVMIFGSLLTTILTGGMESLVGGFVLYETFTAQSDGSFVSVAALVLSYAIVPAFCEELVFRAYLCAEYEHLGVGVSVVASALFFAMLHFSFPLFLTYLLLGVVLATVLYATRSFFAVFALHILYNLFCLFGQPYLTAFYVNAGSTDIFLFCVGVLFLLFAAFGAGEARKIYHLYARANLPSNYTVSRPLRLYPKTLLRALASPWTALCIAVWLVMAILNLKI